MIKSSPTAQSGYPRFGALSQAKRPLSFNDRPLPVVIIARDTPDLAHLMGAFIGRARLALMPDATSATKLIKSLEAREIEVLAVLGFRDIPELT